MTHPVAAGYMSAEGIPVPAPVDHPLIRIAAAMAIVIAKTMSIHPERVGVATAVVALRVAEAGPPGGTPVPVTSEVVFTIWPGIVACMSIGTLQDPPAARVTPPNAQPLPVKSALPGLHVYEPTTSGTRPAG